MAAPGEWLIVPALVLLGASGAVAFYCCCSRGARYMTVDFYMATPEIIAELVDSKGHGSISRADLDNWLKALVGPRGDTRHMKDGWRYDVSRVMEEMTGYADAAAVPRAAFAEYLQEWGI
eukprot:CAMPEP_0174369568 /NCGR_PEP_ID=MMETSP0811_2-20130205/92965_1 /TAXON_ID=73025 ORGANISM="Eutreptiella gymnastica-like, Strain CCMP1594" /NCGR_SAMPLE_ID=MMETSP0811_2 /ASSEMBLY_ACC=CAM_ASM_000667 /LENGTH=119 /DNA_ID=CAMNT_0015514141 /DNA_START=60 /DNA_END=416 /DNA_ORIENTATION=+